MYSYTVYLSVAPSPIGRSPHGALFGDQSEALIRRPNLRSSFVGQLRLRRPRVQVVPDRQAKQRRREFECATPMREVLGSPGIAREPRAHVDAELVQPGLLCVVHRLDQLVVPDQLPVFGNCWLFRGSIPIAGRAQLGTSDD